MADKSQKSDVKEIAHANLVGGRKNFLWKGMEFTLVSNLVCDIIVGLEVLRKHQSITLAFGGTQQTLNFRSTIKRKLSLVCSNIKFPPLFPGMNENTTHIKTPSRKYSKEEQK